jgi:soluble lytic murein transglycosylase-like protein
MLLPTGARAAESVLLANGFTMRCDHHALVDGRLRLYPHADGSEFLDLAPSSVLGFRQLPAAAVANPVVANPVVANPAATPTVATADHATRPTAPVRNAPLHDADLRPILAAAGREHDLDVDLLASIVQAESANNPAAVSRAGARGLMQLMPGTAHEVGVQNAFATSDNVHGGAAYLDWLLDRYHDNLALALAAYNAGPAAVDRYHGVPPYRETRLYVARVIHLFNQRVTERTRRQREATNQASMVHPQ